MKILNCDGGCVLGYETHEEAAAALEALPAKEGRFEHLLAHLKHHGIDAQKPLPETDEVKAPVTSISPETVVPVPVKATEPVAPASPKGK